MADDQAQGRRRGSQLEHRRARRLRPDRPHARRDQGRGAAETRTQARCTRRNWKARKERDAGANAPMLATLAERPFSDPNWLFEIKWDGVRALAWIEGRQVDVACAVGLGHHHAISRTGWTPRRPSAGGKRLSMAKLRCLDDARPQQFRKAARTHARARSRRRS